MPGSFNQDAAARRRRRVSFAPMIGEVSNGNLENGAVLREAVSRAAARRSRASPKQKVLHWAAAALHLEISTSESAASASRAQRTVRKSAGSSVCQVGGMRRTTVPTAEAAPTSAQLLSSK
jgi:hypothetical protein